MAAPSGQFKPGPYFIALGTLLVVLYASVFFLGKSAAPKLGLDLQGGTSLTMSAVTIAGGKQPTADNLAVARDIINQRVDSVGVAEAEVVVQGQNIVVNVAGKGADPKKLQQLAAQAKMEFRQVISAVADNPAAATPVPSASPSASGSPSASSTPKPSGSPSKAPVVAPSKSREAEREFVAVDATECHAQHAAERERGAERGRDRLRHHAAGRREEEARHDGLRPRHVDRDGRR